MAEHPLIQPRTLKGFRDYPPETMIPRERLIGIARDVYRSFGFVPIDTPALEYTEILLGKGGDEADRQLYRFQDHGGRDVALRFDLTVPLARFVAEHAGKLGMPFKRYAIGAVWRGENTQRGRYREFVQCDFDTIGTESLIADVETGVVIHELFARLGFAGFTIRLNHRKLLNGMLERLGLAAQGPAVLRALDKLPKVGRDKVLDEIRGLEGIGDKQLAELGRFLAEAQQPIRVDGAAFESVLPRLAALAGDSPVGRLGVEQLRDVVAGLLAAGVQPVRLCVDLSIARGLDYYTGTIYETFLDELPAIGSVCSGGRYDDLASLYTKQRLPGIGASLGLDRLLAALEELGRLDQRGTTADLFVPYFVAERRDDYLALATELRRAGFPTELYPDPAKLGQQLKYADRRGHRLAVVVGPDEWAQQACQVKDLRSGQAQTVARRDLTATLRRLLDATQ